MRLLKDIQKILSVKHRIEDEVINLLKFVSKLRDDEGLEKEDRLCLHNAQNVCIEILKKLNKF